MSLLHLFFTGVACLGLVLAVLIEIRRGRRENRLWQRFLSHQQMLEPDLH